MAEKKTTTRKPATVDQAGAAELLGITEAELIKSRIRGLPPGTLGLRGDDGKLVWKRKDLKPAVDAGDEEQ